MLTAVAIEKMTPPSARREVPDGKITGLYLVAQPSGARSWALRYRIHGKPRKFTIGSYPAIDLATARRRAQEALGEVASGRDPAAAKIAAREARKAVVEDRVEDVVNDFINLYARKKTRDWKETKRLLEKDVVPAWRGRRLPEIEKKHVAKLLDSIVERGAPIGANRTFAQLRKMCAWAVSRGIIAENPCNRVEAPSPEVARDRVLSPDELSLLWRAAERLPTHGAAVRLLMLTGGRRDEVAGLVWDELNLADATWTLPKARSKNKREHVVPLSDKALEILAGQPRVEGSPFVFGGGRAALGNFALAKQRLDAEIVKLNGGEPIPHWTIHDIRRSVATRIAELGIAPHVLEAVLNHKSGVIRGVAGIYNRHDYLPEKRGALDAWARRLDAIVTGRAAGNVIELAAARG